MMAGSPKLPANAVINLVLNLGSFLPYQYPIPIICVGNLSIGGSGKTPQVEYLINLLIKKYKTAVLSRGYGRRSQNFIYVIMKFLCSKFIEVFWIVWNYRKNKNR